MKPIFGFASLLAAAVVLTSCGSTSESPVENPVGSPTAAASSEINDNELANWPYEEGELLSGTAFPSLPDGVAGEVSVVQIGLFDGTRLPFAYRNNTDAAISHIDWSATARRGGQIVATGSSQGGTPAQVPPRGIGLAFIYFDPDVGLPTDTEYEFSENHMPADATPYNTAPFVITETNDVGESIVGAAVNRTGTTVTGPYGVNVYCFDGDSLLSSVGTYAEQGGDLEDGGTVSFTVDMYGKPCPAYLLGVSGYFNPSE